MKCENCKNYLPAKRDCINYLVIEPNPNNEIGKEVMLNISPPIEGDKHFCGFVCLSEWADKAKRGTGHRREPGHRQ